MDLNFVSEIVAQTLHTDNNTASAVIIASLVVLITVVFLLILYQKAAKRRNTVVLVGLSESGKTLMFTNFAAGPRNLTTYISLKENVCDELQLSPGCQQLTLVDIPGADRLRRRIFDRYLAAASIRAVVFVVDSASYTKLSKDVAEFLYDVIGETPGKVPILVACNKQDLVTAKSAQVCTQYRLLVYVLSTGCFLLHAIL